MRCPSLELGCLSAAGLKPAASANFASIAYKVQRRRATGRSGRVCVLVVAAVRGAPGGPRTRMNIAVRLILNQVCLPIPPPVQQPGARDRPRTCTSLVRLQPLKLACLPISPRGQCLCAAGCSVGLPAWPSWGPIRDLGCNLGPTVAASLRDCGVQGEFRNLDPPLVRRMLCL